MVQEVLLLFWETIKKYSLDLLTLFVAFMTPLAVVFLAMFVFVLADFITGVWKAYVMPKKTVSSRKMSHSVSKFIFYFTGILLSAIANSVLELDMPAAKMVLGFIIVIELRSIDENMKIVLGYSIFGRILDTLKRADIISQSQE